MTDQEILQKSIEKIEIKSIISGYEIDKWKIISPMGKDIYLSAFVWARDSTRFDADHTYEIKIYWQQIIFGHNFAKFFFGEKPQKVYGGIWNTYSKKPTTVQLHEVPVWQYHLQQMVISEEPIKYLEKYL